MMTIYDSISLPKTWPMRGVINWYHQPFAGFPELVVTSNPVNSTEPGERPITFGLNSITGRMSLVYKSCYSREGPR